MGENYVMPYIAGLESFPRPIRDLFYEDPYAQDHNGNTVIHRHISRHYYFHKVTPILFSMASNLEIKNEYGRTAFLHALIHGKKHMIQGLIEAGANVHTTDDEGCNALHYLAIIAKHDIHGWIDLERSLKPLSWLLPFLRSFLEKGVDVNLQNDDGETPLMWAASCHKLKIVQLFLKYGANVHTENKDSLTCLHMASIPSKCNEIMWNEPNANIITELIRNGADVNHFNNDGRTPLGCILHSLHRNRNFMAREFLRIASLVNWETRKDFYILKSRILGGLRVDDYLAKHVDACYAEIWRMRNHNLSEGFNLCHLALRGVSDVEENVASQIRDTALNILVNEHFPIYHSLIFCSFQFDYLQQKLAELGIFTYSTGQKFSLNSDVNRHIASFLNINDLFNFVQAFLEAPL